MPSTTFVLKEPKSAQATLIYLLFRFNGSQLKYSTSQKTLPKNWNPEKQRVRELRTSRDWETINFYLDDLEADINNIYRVLILEGTTPTPEILRKRLDEKLNKVNVSSKDLYHFAEKVLESSYRKAGTKRTIKQTLRNLKEFKEKGNSLHYDSIDLDFYDKYIDFAQKKGYSQNTIGTHIKNIKVFMREAAERGLTKNNSFRAKRFKKIEEESQNIYLSVPELETLAGLDLSDNLKLDRVRDLFLIGCYSGIRYSDLTRIHFENINNEKQVIRITTQKTGETVVIPLNSVCKRIIAKYEGKLPTSISNEKMNEYLKELGQEAKFKEPILVTATKGGEKGTVVYQKWQLITTHTARRSFATNAYLQNVPTISIMKITGHRTEKSFLKYIKISQEDNAQKLLNHKFFN